MKENLQGVIDGNCVDFCCVIGSEHPICVANAKTYKECEVKLKEMIAKKRAEIAAEKERLGAEQSA